MDRLDFVFHKQYRDAVELAIATFNMNRLHEYKFEVIMESIEYFRLVAKQEMSPQLLYDFGMITGKVIAGLTAQAAWQDEMTIAAGTEPPPEE